MEFLAWISRPELEREVLLDPAENDVVAVPQSNLADAQVNDRFGGMHRFAAEGAGELQQRPIPNMPEFIQVVDVLEVRCRRSRRAEPRCPTP